MPQTAGRCRICSLVQGGNQRPAWPGAPPQWGLTSSRRMRVRSDAALQRFDASWSSGMRVSRPLKTIQRSAESISKVAWWQREPC